jgi:hypothetical protein
MVDIKDAIRRLIYRFSSEGAEKVAADTAKIRTETEKTDKASLSLEKSFANLERRYVSTIRAQQDYQKVQDRVNAAVAQNPALQARANVILAEAAAHFGRAAQGGKAFAAAQAEVQARAVSSAAALGSFGGVLSSIGPGGLAVAATLGVAAVGIKQMLDAANGLADRSGKMVDFSESIGLSVVEIQALKKAGAEVGVEADKITSNFEKFSVAIDEVRRGTGALFEQLVRINPELAKEMMLAEGVAQATDVLSRARANAANTEQKNALMRAAFGRGGVGMGRVLDQANAAGGVAGLAAGLQQINVIPDEMARKLDELADKIRITSDMARDNFTSIFAKDVLEAQLKFAETMLRISQAAKSFSMSKDWDKFISDLTGEGLQRVLTLLQGLPIVGPTAAAARVLTEPRSGGFPALSDGPDSGGVAVANERAAAMERAAVAAQQIAFATGNEYETAKALTAEQMLKVQLSSQATVAADLTAAATLRMAQAYPGMSIEVAKVLQAQQGQLAVVSSLTGAERIRAQEQATIAALLLQGKTLIEAQAIAAGQRAIAEAQVRTQIELQIQGLDDEYRLIRAREDGTEATVKAEMAYTRALKASGDAMLAGKVAAAVRRNEIERAEQAEKDAAAAAQRQALQANNAAVDAYNQRLEQAKAIAAGIRHEWANIHGITVDITENLDVITRGLPQFKTWIDSAGQRTQFNPEGYASTTTFGANQDFINASTFGAGGYTPGGGPNAQGVETLINRQLAMGGSLHQAIQTAMQYGQTQLVQTLTALLPQGQQVNAMQQQISQLRTKPATVENLTAIQRLTEQIQQLTQSTDGLNSTMQQSLSPYYSQDPRTTKLGFRAGTKINPDWLVPGASNDNPVGAITGWDGATAGTLTGFANGGSFVVPGGYSATDNKIARFPVASGEEVVVNRSPQGNKAPVNIDARVIIQGNTDPSTIDKIKRSQFKQAQLMQRSMRVA